MELSTWLSYCLVMTAIAYTPGPMTMFSMASGVRHGLARTVPGIFGGSCAYLAQMAIVFFGLGAVVQASTTLFHTIKWIGVAYLLVLGARAWRSRPGKGRGAGFNGRYRAGRQFALGFATGMSNPKSILVFTVLFPHFIDPSGGYASQFAILAATFFVVQGSSAFTYAMFGGRAMDWLARRGKKTANGNKATGAILIAAGGILAFTER